ncbi:hypothetical protein [Actinomadura sp. HBU206391]|uniref:hypothetical protein n=1 Tax=Actinomadura sp. HBU206391 TaxID=2731692 RepID=UPI0021C789CC|nr:hypothetical protein [Actinomadura sp. HBU206391]
MSARIATQERRSLWLASTNSAITVNTCSDQPSTTVWSRSMIRDRPLRSSEILPSKPVVSTPINALTMKIPPMVAVSMRARNGAVPTSPPMVPGSSVRSRLRHSRPGQCPFSSASRGAITTAVVPTIMISTPEARASQPIRADVPLAMVLSNQYRIRSRLLNLANRSPYGQLS